MGDFWKPMVYILFKCFIQSKQMNKEKKNTLEHFSLLEIVFYAFKVVYQKVNTSKCFLSKIYTQPDF